MPARTLQLLVVWTLTAGELTVKRLDTVRFVPMRRNSLRNPATLDVNLSARKSFVLGRTAAALFFEVFNLLNTDDLRIHTYEPVSDAEVADLRHYHLNYLGYKEEYFKIDGAWAR